MPWDTSRPGSDPKYATAEHRNRRAVLVKAIKAGEYVACRAKVCLYNRAPITNPNGNEPDGLNLGHEDDGITYRGAEHRACNLHDGAVRGRAKQGSTTTTRRWVL